MLPESDFYDAVRRRIEQEDNFNVNRLTWLMAPNHSCFRPSRWW
ncbi:hypothetical protein BH18VER1_BH18VER1_18690 [soil metagenome]